MKAEQGRKARGPQKSAGALDGAMRSTLMAVAITAAVMSLGALATYGSRAALGVAIGGVIAVANLYVFARVGEAFVSRKGRTAPWAVIAVVKLIALLGGVWFILKTGVVPPLALTAGYASLIFGITIGSLFGPRPPEDDEPGEEIDAGR